MINARKPDYAETLLQLEEAKDLMIKIERGATLQLPQGMTKEFDSIKSNFLVWVAEAELTLEDYISNA